MKSHNNSHTRDKITNTQTPSYSDTHTLTHTHTHTLLRDHSGVQIANLPRLTTKLEVAREESSVEN